jgi:macrolide transport system ATP-binding/permease protein
MSIFRRITNLFTRDRVQREIDAELRSHLDLRIEDNLAAGMSRDEARRDALNRFGNRGVIQERTTEADAALVLESIWADLRYALRQLRKNPGFTATAILMIALGMGASISIFAFVDAALIRPMPFRDPARLVSVYEVAGGCPLCNVSRQNWQDWKKMDTVFSSFQTWGWVSYLLHGPEGTTPARGARVSDGFFQNLGVKPILGRDFYAGEDKPGAPRTTLLSYAAWQKRYAGNPSVVGQSIRLGDDSYAIIGVLPREYHFAPLGEADFWTALNVLDSCEQRRGCHNLFGVARLKDGVTVASAAAEMRTLAAQFAHQYPDSNHDMSAIAIPLSQSIIGDIRPILLMLLSGASLLWLIACVNVVSLLLVRSETRRQEIAVRGALGASRWRLARQFLIESLVLVATGTAFGLTSAYSAMQLLLKLIPASRMEGMPYLLGLGSGSHVLIFSASMAMLAALGFAIAPSLRLALATQSSNLRTNLAGGGRGGSGNTWRKLGSRLVVVELATAVVLLVGAGLLGKSLYLLLHVDLGLQPDHLATLVVSAPVSYVSDTGIVAFDRRIQSGIAAIPGVQSVAISSHLPAHSWDGGVPLVVFGRTTAKPFAPTPERDVSANYLHTIGATLLRGRYFTDAEDDPSKPRIVVINHALADQFFPGENPIGKRLAYDRGKDTLEIVGEIENIKEGPIDTPGRPVVYVPFSQDWYHSFYLVVRTAQNEASFLPKLAAAVHRIDAQLAVSDTATMDDLIQQSQAAYLHRSSAWLVSGFAALALILSVVGLYGVIAYSVSQRTREIGVRMALGARQASVYQLILKEAAGLSAIGIAAGLICAVIAATLMRSLLFGTQAWDAVTLSAVATVLGVSALLASYIPARRAASVNPVEALRAE